LPRAPSRGEREKVSKMRRQSSSPPCFSWRRLTPLGFFVKLFAGAIRKQVPKQTVAAMESRRQLLAPDAAHFLLPPAVIALADGGLQRLHGKPGKKCSTQGSDQLGRDVDPGPGGGGGGVRVQ
jgi:hypothetical protein